MVPAGAQHDHEATAWVDSDWAGCRYTRRSRSGGIVKIAGCVIASWSHVKGTVACSAAEAEYFSMCTGAAEALFVHLLASELGISSQRIPPRIFTEASAAKAMAERTGLPTRAKRIEIRYLLFSSSAVGGLSSSRSVRR